MCLRAAASDVLTGESDVDALCERLVFSSSSRYHPREPVAGGSSPEGLEASAAKMMWGLADNGCQNRGQIFGDIVCYRVMLRVRP